jgi:hypothetical protein
MSTVDTLNPFRTLVIVLGYIDPSLDRLGKEHSPPGMRIAKKIEDSHQLEASLASNVNIVLINNFFFFFVHILIFLLDIP